MKSVAQKTITPIINDSDFFSSDVQGPAFCSSFSRYSLPPGSKDRNDVRWQKRHQPLAPQHPSVADVLNDAAAGYCGSAGDDRFVEHTRRICEDQEHATADVAPDTEPKGRDQTRCDGSHNRHPRHSRRNEERQQKVRDDKCEKQSRVAGADSQGNKVRKAFRQTGFACHRAEEKGTHQEPGSVICKAAESSVEIHDSESPEKITADKASQAVIHDFRCPTKNHEERDGDSVLSLRFEVQGKKPERNRNEQS